MTDEQRRALRQICAALNFAMIEADRERERQRREARRPKRRPPVAPMPSAPVRLTDEEILEDVQWLLGAGEYPDRIARRMGKTPSALARWLHRRDRRDLAVRFERVNAA